MELMIKRSVFHLCNSENVVCILLNHVRQELQTMIQTDGLTHVTMALVVPIAKFIGGE